MRYFIKKSIEAKNPMDALKRERDAEITDVWKDDESKQLTSVIGFQREQIDENDNIPH